MMPMSVAGILNLFLVIIRNAFQQCLPRAERERNEAMKNDRVAHR